MKVAFISGCLEYSVCLANALSRRCRLDYFYNGAAVGQRDGSILSLLAPEIGRREINALRLRDPRNLLSYREVARSLAGYDVVHIQGSDIWLSLNRGCFGAVPIVCTIHDPQQHVGLPWLNRIFQAAAQRIAVAHSSGFIVHGERLKLLLARSSGLASDRISVIPHGEFSFYRELRDAPSAGNGRHTGKRILFFGEVRKNKGLADLIAAEPMISQRLGDYRICIAGRFRQEKGNNLEHYRSLMRDPGRFEIHDRFIATGEVAGLFESTDVVVLPYVGASQSGILAIAFGFGTPVVATDTGSMGEVVTHGETGLLVPPGDPGALADALLRVLLDDGLRRSFRDNSLQVAQGFLNWDGIADQTLEVYRRAINGARQ